MANKVNAVPDRDFQQLFKERRKMQRRQKQRIQEANVDATDNQAKRTDSEKVRK